MTDAGCVEPKGLHSFEAAFRKEVSSRCTKSRPSALPQVGRAAGAWNPEVYDYQDGKVW